MIRALLTLIVCRTLLTARPYRSSFFTTTLSEVLSSTSYLSFSLVLGLNEVDNVSLHVSKEITANGA
jgi:hypothetical protein